MGSLSYLKYVDADSLLHRLDPRTKFAFFVVMAIVTSIVKSGVALVFLFAFFIAMWCACSIQKYIVVLEQNLKVLLLFIFLLWLVLGLFERPAVEGGPIFIETVIAEMESTLCGGIRYRSGIPDYPDDHH